MHLRCSSSSNRLILMPFLGFASGLPLALTAGTLQSWLTEQGLDIRAIGLFAAVALPYSLKFLWSPILDRYTPPLFGRRRGWMLICQLGLMFAIGLLPVCITYGVFALMMGALIVAFLSATQDIAFDAYRTELLLPTERGIGAAWSVNGYRLGMLVSGAVALVLSEQVGWPVTYLTMAALMLIGVIATLLGDEPQEPVRMPHSLAQAVIEPLSEFMIRPRAITIIAFVAFYKLGDALVGALNYSFLLGELHFTATEVGTINKGAGFLGSLAGAFAGGLLLSQVGMYKALLTAGLLQAVTNLGYVLLVPLGKDYPAMMSVVTLENVAGGMGTTAFVALLMGLCNRRYTATQYALLSASSSAGRVIFGPVTGFIVSGWGWVTFFMGTAVAALPGLLLLYLLRNDLAFGKADLEASDAKSQSGD